MRKTRSVSTDRVFRFPGLFLSSSTSSLLCRTCPPAGRHGGRKSGRHPLDGRIHRTHVGHRIADAQPAGLLGRSGAGPGVAAAAGGRRYRDAPNDFDPSTPAGPRRHVLRIHQPSFRIAARIRAEREPTRFVAPVRCMRAFWSSWVPAAPDAANANRCETSSSGKAKPAALDSLLALPIESTRFQ